MSKAVTIRKQAPARTLEAREKQLIALAYDLVEKRISEGTATSQEVTHFLKLGSTTESLAKKKLETENELLKAKIDSLKSTQKIEELYMNALNAMRRYGGQTDGGESPDDAED